MLAAFAMLIAASTASADIRPLLRHQGFDGPINGRETIRYVGGIHEGRNRYQIYLYHGVFRAAVLDHGVNRLIVMLNASTFVGAYDSSMAKTCKVRGRKVICDKGVIEFTRSGPLARVLLDGQLVELAGGLKE